MIREYAPIPLIPAAWAMTFATVIYPGIDTYWIEHMHYFMLLFLTGFTILSWNQMQEDPVLDIWRKVIAAGILFTGIGAANFILPGTSFTMSFLTVAYWFLAPAIALYLSAEHMDKYSKLYERLAYTSGAAYLLYVTSLYISLDLIEYNEFAIASFVLIAAAQTASIITASELDNE